jgi:gliding motility-associated-like protein
MRFFLIILLIIPLLKVSAQTTQWVKSAGGPNSDKGINIGMDGEGFIYISGYFDTEATFGPHVISGNNKEFFVAKMDPITGDFLWATSGGSGPDDRALGMHVDQDGFVYLTGKTWFGANFGGAPVYGIGGYEQSFITKIDKNGNWLWAKLYGAPSGGWYQLSYFPFGNIMVGDDHCWDVETDASGNIYVTGWWSNVDCYFDAFTLSNPAWAVDTTTMGYVGKLDPNGNFLWVQKYDGVDDKVGERDNRLAIDRSDGSVYVTGGFRNTGWYGTDSLVSRGDWDIFVTKLDNSGNFVWSRRAGSNKGDRGNGIAISDDGDVYICGEFRNDADFGTDSLNHKKRKDIFVAKLRPDGDWVWARRAKKSAGKDRANQMTVSHDERLFLTGEIGDTIKFGDTIINNDYDNQNAFVASMSKNGTWLWVKVAQGPPDGDRGNNIVVDHYGNCYIVGYYQGTTDFDGHLLTAQARKDIFVWKINDPNTPVVEIPLPKGIHVPTGFSPNNDGNNDLLFVYGGQIKTLSFDVYDRWGIIAFSTSDLTEGWDGTINGKQASAGVYVYRVKVTYTDGEIESSTGNVTLVR